MSETTYWLFITEGDVEPTVRGPFPSEASRNKGALKEREKRGDKDGIFMLDITDGYPAVYAYSNGFMERARRL